MDSRFRCALALLLVFLLACFLTLALSSGEPARAMLQTSPFESPVETPVATSTPAPTVGDFPTLEPPTSVPLPVPAGPTATPRGFLPAPTIVNPNDLQSLPLAQPPVPGTGSLSEPTPAPPAPAITNPTTRAAVALLNYLWLLCGGMLLVGGAVAILLLWRRGRHA